MTLADGIRKVYMLLDEYSTGGTVTVDADVAAKMKDFFDIAQKDIAQYQKIVRETTLTLDSETDLYELPADCRKVFRVWLDGALTNRYVLRSGGIAFPSGGKNQKTKITLDSVTSAYALPADFFRAVSVLRNGEKTDNYSIADGNIVFSDTATGVQESVIALDAMTSSYALPEDFFRVVSVLRNGVEIHNFNLVGNRIELPGLSDGAVTLQYVKRMGTVLVEYAALLGMVRVEYFARPQTIGADTEKTYEFEVSEEAANCLPFFVAAQHLIADLVVDYSAFLQMYYQMRNALDVTLPEGDGTGSVRQVMFR